MLLIFSKFIFQNVRVRVIGEPFFNTHKFIKDAIILCFILTAQNQMILPYVSVSIHLFLIIKQNLP